MPPTPEKQWKPFVYGSGERGDCEGDGGGGGREGGGGGGAGGAHDAQVARQPDRSLL